MTAFGPTTRYYKTIFLSDIHLGTRGCKAEMLLDFLKYTESETLYLVGDIVDGWRLKKHWHWPQPHNDVIQKLLRKARKGTRVIFIPGNHDEFARDYCDADFGDVELRREIIHEGADGRRYLVIHGDEFDGVVLYARWLAVLGDWAYVTVLELNHWFNVARRRLGLPYWSVSQYLKHKVKNAVQYITKFEDSMAELARKRGVDGIICGHIHHAEIRQVGEVLYCNDGDWVESCTAMVEHADGRMEIIDWTKVRDVSMVEVYRGRGRRKDVGSDTEPEPAEETVPLAQVREVTGQSPAQARGSGGGAEADRPRESSGMA
ncbi:UDP-2,3-diacylglucosamine diphosphatase [uncultured Rhodospira sp.]|uniref:UDP-2,3-diacylglucosamine diphosphatase n=1 Tax=uncultured Rhodospira sp. TaxID=1936189 RepID=UPI002621ACA4|nr:UDP-2,3-diacylglucosamine diphosphatase [uncultured Rhodospira sp.]